MRPNHKNYIPVRIDDFTAGLKTPVDLFVRLGEHDFKKIYSAGERTDSAQLYSIENRKINYLWVKNDEYPKLSKQNVLIAGIAVKSDKYSITDKSRFVAAASATMFRDYSSTGINTGNFSHAQEVASATVKLIEHHQDLFELMEHLSECSDELVKFSTLVAASSVVVGMGMGWKNPVTMEKLSIGGLLHKIGLLDLPDEIIYTPVKRMNESQHSVYRTYPQRSFSKLSKLGIVPDDVLSIVLEHQERPKGQGFPRMLPDNRIHPMARVVGLAEEFTTLSVPNLNNEKRRTPDQVYKILRDEKEHMFNKEIFSAFSKMLGRNSLKKAV